MRDPSLARLSRHIPKVLRHQHLCSLSVVHASCDAGHSTSCHLSAFIRGVVYLSYDVCHSLPHHLLGFIGGVVWESGDAVLRSH